MTSRPRRYQHNGNLHFIPFSCHRRQANLAAARARAVFEYLLERTRLLPRYG